ncbi:MAG: Coenzyme F420 hydrogenase/dehydrogenase, beta subunit C-terminal domain [Smithella sp.]|jgi:coenzyme F420-reducing hydrogenase beta subunit
MKAAIEIITQNRCTGCFGCYNTCPVANAIKMKYDETGFFKPFLSKDCTDCGICQNGCPVIEHSQNINKVKKGFVGWSNDKDIIMNSSSGGIFSELSYLVLAQKGVVYGVGWVDGYPKHKRVTTFEELKDLRGSKYLQSNVEYSYSKALEDLRSGRLVLFSGVPCQIAALNKLTKNNKLLTVDLICHGVPSRKAYDKYCEEKFQNKITQVDFRNKDKGWVNFSVCMHCDNGKIYKNIFKYDRFFKGFLKDIYLNEACYACEFKGNNDGSGRVADITLGDFWGVPKKYFNHNGVSFIVSNNEKGFSYIDKLKKERDVYLQEIEIKLGLKSNPLYYMSVNRPSERDFFFQEIGKKSFVELSNKYFRPWNKLEQIIINILRLPMRVVRYLLNKLKD